MAAVETGRRIRGDGDTAESVWQQWLAAAPPPTVQLDDLLAASERLVVVSPHPDDEVLACGGLITLHARRGGEVAIAAVTDGEASHRDDPRWSATFLADARRIERRRGLVRLGLADDPVTRLALPDGGVEAHRDTLARSLRALLRPTDCVIATWHLDGHPDHDASGAAAARACVESGCRLLEAPVWMWHWSAPDDPRVPWARLRALALPSDAQAAKAAALAEHATQLTTRGHDAPVLGPAILARAARGAEYFFV